MERMNHYNLHMIPKKINIKNIPETHQLVEKGKEHLQTNVFIHPKKKEHFKTNHTHYYQCNHNHTTICLFLNHSNCKNTWIKKVKMMFGRINFSRKLFNNFKPLYIWVWNSKDKKKFPVSSKHFTEDNINSGSTVLEIFSLSNGEICLWREEELLKVLLHELVHAFREEKFDPPPQEAYVEYRAVLMNIYLELLERNLPLSLVPILLEKEKNYGKSLCKKIRGYKYGKTNVAAYLDERNRLLNKVNRDEWEKIMKHTKKYNGKELLFTISEKKLKKHFDVGCYKKMNNFPKESYKFYTKQN
jgi:hypothetical protein